MPVTATQIREMASNSTVEVILTDGRTFMIHSPEHFAASPSGSRVMLTSGGEVLVLVEVGEVAAVRVAVPDSNVEMLRRGEVPGWLRDRMRGYPELFIMAARMDPEELARLLGWTEVELER
jgi:hypothetical protein